MTFTQLLIIIITTGVIIGGISYSLMKDIDKPLLKNMELREKELELALLKEKNKNLK